MNLKILQSGMINLLRFPLIIGVVFIYNYCSNAVIQGISYGFSEIALEE